MTIAARVLLALNRIFPRPIDYGGDSADAYSAWEYTTGKVVHERFFARQIGLQGARILDVGCGAGGKLVFYAEQSPRSIDAIDLSESNLSQARRFAAVRGVEQRISFLRADAAGLPYADGVFDVVTATDTFEHLAKPAQTVEEIGRVLRPGGRLLFYFTPYRSPLGSHLYDLIHVPWCHLLFRESVLFEAIEEICQRQETRRTEPNARNHARRRVAENRAYFHDALNQMTVAKFQRLLSSVPELTVDFLYRKPLKTKLLAPFTRIRPFDELLTTLIVGILRKPGRA